MLVLLILSAQSGWQPEGPIGTHRTRRTDVPKDDVENASMDPSGPAYKQALATSFDKQRAERYAHLTGKRYESLRDLVVEFSDTFVIDGAPCGVVEGYEFDIELEPNAKPVRHQLPKLSVQEMEKEHYHINNAESLSH